MVTYTVDILHSGTEIWCMDGGKHRVDGPAVTNADGEQGWYLDGVYHREGGPAIERANGHKEWWQLGERHRLDGPAIEYANGEKVWCIDGRCSTEKVEALLRKRYS